MFHRDRPHLSLVHFSPPEADVLVKKGLGVVFPSVHSSCA